MKTIRPFCSGFLALAIAGCSSANIKYVKPDFGAPDFVAVLPPDNQSNDLQAPRAVIGAVSSALIGIGYFPILTPAQEKILREMGMTDGGQIRAFKLPDLAEKLGTDGIMVTTIDQFSEINIGFYISPNVESTIAVYNKTGEKLWEANSKYTEKQLNLNPIKALQAGIANLTEQFLSKIFNTHLIMESQMMGGLLVRQALLNKPNLAYPGPSYKAPANSSANIK